MSNQHEYTMKERPILFSAPMVRAILEGRKTQTRRIVKLRDGSLAEDEDIPAHGECGGLAIPAPDYVMDFSKTFPQWQKMPCPYGKTGDRLWVRETWCPDFEPYTFKYRADGGESVGRWHPSIHMPRWASRITLEVVSVRVERLQDISEADAEAEGFPGDVGCPLAPTEWYSGLWNTLHAGSEYLWADNPWVVAVSFNVRLGNIDGETQQ